MSLHPLAGKPAPSDLLINVTQLIEAYYSQHPDAHELTQKISFGTSGHRGSSLKNTFNQDHILAICQALVEIRKRNKVNGPLFIGKDTHALSEPALLTAIEVFSANQIDIIIDKDLGYTPTPVISHAILTYNKNHKNSIADGIVITPSHNPPEDGGLKYNPPNGGPADTKLTRMIENRANEILVNGLKEVKKIPHEKGIKSSTTQRYDYILPYVNDLESVINMALIASADLKIGVDPMGGSGLNFWKPIAEMYHLNIEVVNDRIDPSFSFMRVDKDGKIRMDCSSPYAMAGLIDMKNKFDIAFGNDPDYDRHGIVTKSDGLINPNHYLAVAVQYLFNHRQEWSKTTAIGKTLVSSAMIDRIAKQLHRNLIEVPVGFKWFVEGLLSGKLGFGGEESAGAAFLRKNGSVWTTDKDGIIMDLLAAEMTAAMGEDPAEQYELLENKYGSPVYERMDVPTTFEKKEVLKAVDPTLIKTQSLAGERIVQKLSDAPGNNAAIGGVKVITENGWFAARPSGTEDIYKIYAESFVGKSHLIQILDEAQDIVNKAFKEAGIS